MAKYRLVSVHIWNDPDFEELTATEKTVFLYLITNNATTDSGIYTITPKKISNETSVPIQTVTKLLGNYKNLSYDVDNKCVFIHYFLQYNGGGNPELLKKAFARESKHFKTPLWNEFIEKYPQYEDVISSQVGTVNKQFISEDKIGEDKIGTIEFDKFWKMYPERDGKKLGREKARQYFIKNIKLSEYDKLLIATKNYSVSKNVKNGYAKDAERWLKVWKEWIEPEKIQGKQSEGSKRFDEVYKDM